MAGMNRYVVVGVMRNMLCVVWGEKCVRWIARDWKDK
jgi:hypothetical protein